MNRFVISFYLVAGIASLNFSISCTNEKNNAPPPSGESDSSTPPEDGGPTGNNPWSKGTFGGGQEGTADSASTYDSGADGSAYIDGGVESGADGGAVSGAAEGENGRVIGITAAHNAVRARTNGGAAGSLPPLDWSVEVASIAQAYADDLAAGGCEPVGSDNGYGENLAYYSGQKATAKQVVEDWAGEMGCYTYGTFLDNDKCGTPCDECSHYTQIVWRATSEVGCGVATCSSAPYREIWVCNYNPAGNYIGQFPY